MLFRSQQSILLPPPESLGTLLADIAWDYQRLGEEFATLNNDTITTTALSSSSSVGVQAQPQPITTTSKMECIFLEMEYGIVGISPCNNNSGNSNNYNSNNIGCFVMVIATSEAPLGLIRMRLQTVTQHIQESLFLSSSSSSSPVPTISDNATADNTNLSLPVT